MMNDAALISDAGTPLLSDPGYKLVKGAKEAGIKIVPVPGPFAGAAALSASGLPTNKVLFWGFLPKNWEFLPETTTVVYESPIRAKKTVTEILKRYPLAKIVVAREMTKIHEMFVDGHDFIKLEGRTKGEVTILAYLPRC
jgi:16S rRNA (cytidine1402-2'-O)-methyltransferase